MLWDSGLIKNITVDADALTASLQAGKPTTDDSDLSVARAAEESCRIVDLPGFYPERRLGKDYIEPFKPVLEQRLATAGHSLRITNPFVVTLRDMVHPRTESPYVQRLRLMWANTRETVIEARDKVPEKAP